MPREVRCDKCYGRGCHRCVSDKSKSSKESQKPYKPASKPQQSSDLPSSNLRMPSNLDKSVVATERDKNGRPVIPSRFLSGSDRTEKSSSKPSTNSSSKMQMSSRLDVSRKDNYLTPPPDIDNFFNATERSSSHTKKTRITVSADPRASKQLNYRSLNPREQSEQDIWARRQLALAGFCPAGFSWNRVDDGYICSGGAHIVTDELLAEGKERFYVRDLLGPFGGGPWTGPMTGAEEFKMLHVRNIPSPPGAAGWIPFGNLPNIPIANNLSSIRENVKSSEGANGLDLYRGEDLNPYGREGIPLRLTGANRFSPSSGNRRDQMGGSGLNYLTGNRRNGMRGNGLSLSGGRRDAMRGNRPSLTGWMPGR